jgi:hypothetical protein
MNRPEFSQTDDEFEKALLEAMTTPITDDSPPDQYLGCFRVPDDLPPYDQPSAGILMIPDELEFPSDNDQD